MNPQMAESNIYGHMNYLEASGYVHPSAKVLCDLVVYIILAHLCMSVVECSTLL